MENKEKNNFEGKMKSIYKIYCKDENIKDIYIGQTLNINKRINSHKNACYNKKYKKQKVHKFIIKNGGWENWFFVEIEKVFIEYANQREMFWITELNATLNKTYTIVKSQTVDKTQYNKL